MNFAVYYIEANLILVVTALVIAMLTQIASSSRTFIGHREIRKIALPLSLFPIAYFLVSPFLPTRSFFDPAIEIWAADSMNSPAPLLHGPAPGILKVEALSDISIPITHFDQFLGGLILLGILYGLFRIAKDMRSLQKILNTSLVYKEIKNVQILISNQIQIPFSLWRFGMRSVVLPSSFLNLKDYFKISVFHELQHHRQGDTLWTLLILASKYFFFFNPFIHRIQNNLDQLQELACDEALVSREKVSPLTYGRCLIEIAQGTLKSKRQILWGVGMSACTSPSKLKRRIHQMLSFKSKTQTPIRSAFVFGLSLIILSGTAYATRGNIQDRRLTLQEAEELISQFKNKTEFPLEVNDQVLTELNRFVGTPDGRKNIQQAFARMKNIGPVIMKGIRNYGYPEDLISVAMAESGFQNFKKEMNPLGAAGLWQFLDTTARQYNLKVNATVDERLHQELSTDAAMRLLGSLKLRFQDWKLALLAYNVGATRVQNSIDRVGSRDAWVLIKNGLVTDTGYLPRVIASAIIIKNPDLVY